MVLITSSCCTVPSVRYVGRYHGEDTHSARRNTPAAARMWRALRRARFVDLKKN